ncbi:MAG: hypothetical protein ACJ77Q_04710, partial [Gemmatimonadaceae bacterium]
MKAFLGGWEQTSTISVQCLVTPFDCVLNDTTLNFMVRDSILDTFVRANGDSAFDAGFDVAHPWQGKGWIHETEVEIWKLPNGGGTAADTTIETFSDACRFSGTLQRPAPTAVLLALIHPHPSPPGKPQYCQRKVQRRPDQPAQDGATSPAEAAQGRPYLFAGPDTAPADRADRTNADNLHVPDYVLKHNGWLLKIDPVADTS